MANPERIPWDNRAWAYRRRLSPSFWVYLLYDQATEDLLYVGATKNIKRRLTEHHAGQYRRDSVRCEVERFRTQVAANTREVQLIRELNPRDNKLLNPSWPVSSI